MLSVCGWTTMPKPCVVGKDVRPRKLSVVTKKDVELLKFRRIVFDIVVYLDKAIELGNFRVFENCLKHLRRGLDRPRYSKHISNELRTGQILEN